jgi:hypothetical protein
MPALRARPRGCRVSSQEETGMTPTMRARQKKKAAVKAKPVKGGGL